MARLLLILSGLAVVVATVSNVTEKATVSNETEKPKDDQKLPFTDVEGYGRIDKAKELTKKSVDETNSMVDQLEKAEVAEMKRSQFRALTRLRGVVVSSFDGVAQEHTENIEHHNKKGGKWRDEHPIKHLATEESDVSHWAFPAKAD
mmetsp:Transcript_47723/g.85930  ORF Transcript_47723/g.85930 Transcript_47723/m.85930 type:complete len:147 (-) Transcript_47723:26-466(-)